MPTFSMEDFTIDKNDVIVNKNKIWSFITKTSIKKYCYLKGIMVYKCTYTYVTSIERITRFKLEDKIIAFDNKHEYLIPHPDRKYKRILSNKYFERINILNMFTTWTWSETTQIGDALTSTFIMYIFETEDELLQYKQQCNSDNNNI